MDEQEVSLHSLTNTSSPQIFRIFAVCGKQAVEVLIDTGSHSSFIQETLVDRLGLENEPSNRFKVYMGNGQHLFCERRCNGVKIIMQGHEFVVDLYVLPIWRIDIVFGMQWLRTLGPCLHDHEELTMKFSWNGRQVCLIGKSGVDAGEVSKNKMSMLLQSHNICTLYTVYSMHEDGGNFPSFKIKSSSNKLNNAEEIILKEYGKTFEEPKDLPPRRPIDHQIHLVQGSDPINVRPYRYPYFQKDVMEAMVKEMLDRGYIRHSSSPYSSPVLLVKKDGSWRFCVDYRALNAITIRDRFPIPTIDELLDELGAAVVFSKLDLRTGYHYEFVVIPFGLSNSPSTFQSVMNQLFQSYLRKFVIVFFDDILVYSRSGKEHCFHLQNVLESIQEQGVFPKKSKCQFFQDTIEYLGHIVTGGVVKADPKKIEAMIQWPTPANIKQLRGFLGITGYYRRFIKDYATIAAPLTDFLKKYSYAWVEAAHASFDELKRTMVTPPILRLPDFSQIFVLETDASQVGIGAVLMQEDRPIAYFSKKFDSHMQKASTYTRELYVVTESIMKFRQYLMGREFKICTDHRRLKELLTQVIQTPEQQRFLRKLMGFPFVVEYKPGRDNMAADSLSRVLDVEQIMALNDACSNPVFDFLNTLQEENSKLVDVLELHQKMASNPAENTDFSVRDGILLYKNKFFLGTTSNLKSVMLK